MRLAQNPTDCVDLPRQTRTEMKVLSPDETRRFLDEARKDRLGAMFAVAVTTGLRLSEYLALKWSDLDLIAAKLTVNRSLDWMKGGGAGPSRRAGRSAIVPAPRSWFAQVTGKKRWPALAEIVGAPFFRLGHGAFHRTFFRLRSAGPPERKDRRASDQIRMHPVCPLPVGPSSTP